MKRCIMSESFKLSVAYMDVGQGREQERKLCEFEQGCSYFAGAQGCAER